MKEKGAEITLPLKDIKHLEVLENQLLEEPIHCTCVNHVRIKPLSVQLPKNLLLCTFRSAVLSVQSFVMSQIDDEVIIEWNN